MSLIKVILLMFTGLMFVNGCAVASIDSTREDDPSAKMTQKGSVVKESGEVWTHFAQ